jgi:hypothetical protein
MIVPKKSSEYLNMNIQQRIGIGGQVEIRNKYEITIFKFSKQRKLKYEISKNSGGNPIYYRDIKLAYHFLNLFFRHWDFCHWQFVSDFGLGASNFNQCHISQGRTKCF